MRFAPLPEDHLEALHLGFAINRSVGNAVVRNRIRRRLRALMREFDAELGPGLYLLGASSGDAGTVGFDDLRRDLRSVLANVTQNDRKHSS